MASLKSHWKDQVILITGASSGIGEALAREAVRLGARVALGARRIERLKAIQSELGSQKVFVHVCDVTSKDSQSQFVAASVTHFGKIDLVVANAGFGVSGDFKNLRPEDFRRQFETNVFGLLDTCHLSLPHLVTTKGRLCLIGSVMSYVSYGGSAPYSMSKFAVKALADSLYHEYKPLGVSVTLICPGLIESEFREVDNQGRHHAGSRDPLPSWIVMRKNLAAQKILKACLERTREVVITLHGKLGVSLVRHWPGLFHWLVERLKIKSGKQKAKAAQASSLS